MTAVAPPAHVHDPNADARIGWVEKTLSGIAGNIERAIFTEQHARIPAFLQRVDPRAKLGMFLAMILAASLTSSYAVLAILYAIVVAAAVASRIPTDFFVKRVWLGIPLFAGIVVIPAIFFVAGPRLFELTLGPITIAPVHPGHRRRRAPDHARRGERLARGPAGHDHAVGGPAQEPAGDPDAADLRAHPVDDLPLHLPVPAHDQRHLPRPEEPARGTDTRRRSNGAGSAGRWAA